MNSAKELLKAKQFQSVLESFKNTNFTDRNVYANWLAQTYYFVSHSVRLSALGASKLSVHEPLSRRMIAHTTEEMGHHTIAQNDIRALGEKMEHFPELGVTKAFYQSQYYKVLFEHPAHLLGQIVMLEAVSVELGPWLYSVVKECYGDNAAKFVKVHAEEDQDHVEKALASIDKLPTENRIGVAENFMQACEMYSLILRTIGESAVNTQHKIPA